MAHQFNTSRLGKMGVFRNHIVLGVAATALLISGCSSTSGSKSTASGATAVNMVDTFPQIDPGAITVASIRDTIKIGDRINMRVINEESLSGIYVVDRSGNIAFPFVGTMNVSGMNTQALREQLTEMFARDYLQDPTVVIDLEARTLGKVIVDGAVDRPGVFEISDIITLSEAIALSGGLGPDAKGDNVFIVRNVNGTRMVQSVDIDQVRRAEVADPQLIPNDMVFVDESKGRAAFREFLRAVPLLNTAAILSR